MIENIISELFSFELSDFRFFLIIFKSFANLEVIFNRFNSGLSCMLSKIIFVFDTIYIYFTFEQ